MTVHCCGKRISFLVLGIFELIWAVGSVITSIYDLAKEEWSTSSTETEKYLKFWVISAILCAVHIAVISLYTYAANQDQPRLMVPFLAWMILSMFALIILAVMKIINNLLTPSLAAIFVAAGAVKLFLFWLVYSHLKEEATVGEPLVPLG